MININLDGWHVTIMVCVMIVATAWVMRGCQ
jgi:hypothetical protein